MGRRAHGNFVQWVNLGGLPHSHYASYVITSGFQSTQLARRVQPVGSNKEARKRLTESNGTPAKDPQHIADLVLQHSPGI